MKTTTSPAPRFHGVFDGPLGRVLVVAKADGLVGVYFEGQKYFPAAIGLGKRLDSQSHIARALAQIGEYFAGTRRRFDLTLAPEGGEFALNVWGELARIDYGTTVTYGEVARRLGKPNAARAVGTATGRNPLSLVIPCHRLIGAGGQLTGYAGGLARKAKLLEMESRLVPKAAVTYDGRPWPSSSHAKA